MSRRVLWTPVILHPAAARKAAETWDVMTPDDARASEWWKHADAAVVREGSFPADIVRQAKRLRIIARNGVGVNNLPLDVCKEQGIAVTVLPGYNSSAVAELCLALALSVSRKVPQLDKSMRAGKPLGYLERMSRGLDRKTVGLVGMGNIAREVARKFVGAFGCEILVYSPTTARTAWTSEDPEGAVPHRRVDSVDELVEACEVLSLHCPLKEATEGMVGRKQLELLGPHGIVINTARGGLVDERALLEVLRERKIYGAGLDLIVAESSTPEVYDELFQLDNVVVTPHVGAGTDEVQSGSCLLALEQCNKLFAGEEPENRIV